ncbi:MAG: hypothetical protein SOS98_04000 [Varibaculum sp.]|nr:hypothetical protein [Varibaculum sp.]
MRYRFLYPPFVALLFLALAGCANMPMSGPVVEATVAAGSRAQLVQQAQGPRDNSTRQQLVSDFLNAVGAGSYDYFEVARQYLTANANERWHPEVSAVVFDDSAAPKLTVSGSTVTVASRMVITVDSHGVPTPADADDATLETSFTLRKVSGQWRIDDLPQGILIPQTAFQNSYVLRRVYYPDSSSQYLVADPRWVPRSEAERQLVLSLINGPSKPLNEVVSSAFPLAIADGKGVSVDIDSEKNLAFVSLPNIAGGYSAKQLENIQWQLDETLVEDGTTASVQLFVGDKLIKPENFNTRVHLHKQPPDRLVGLRDGDLVSLSGTKTDVLARAESFSGLRIAALAQSFDSEPDVVALVPGTGIIQLTPQVRELYSVPDSLPPKYDSRGWIWYGSHTDTNRIRLGNSDGGDALLDLPWDDFKELTGLAVSPDGSHLLLVGRVATGEYRASVALIVRNTDGRPERLRELPNRLSSLTELFDPVWTDTLKSAVLAADGTVHELSLGGFTQSYTAPKGVVRLLGGASTGTLEAVGDDWVRYLRVSDSWRNSGGNLDRPCYP